MVLDSLRMKAVVMLGSLRVGVRVFVVLVLGVVGVLLVVPSSVFAVVSAPAWRVSSVSVPTAFTSEANGVDQFQLRLANVGDVVSDGSTVTVVDTLPVGLVTSPRAAGSANNGSFWSCSPVGMGNHQVTCTHSGAVFAFSQLPPINVYVQVESGLIGEDIELTNHVSVSGGGAATVEVSSGVVVEPSVSLPFGVADLESYPAGIAGIPETQAAGHATSFNTSFDLNSVFVGGAAVNPAREVKDIVVDLPVGFVGNPETLPRCPQGLLASGSGETASRCPSNTRVGVVTWSGAGLYHESESIYNLVPGPGEPAAFGFVYEGQRILMHASVRTGSDYGLRVGIPGIPTLVHFQGAEVIFFGNPSIQNGEAAPGNAFFTNPSRCSGEPLKTIIHADSWVDPAKVPLNPDGSLDLNAADFSESQWKTVVSEAPAVEGCEALTFEPSFSFQPENHEASSPSGYSVDLHIPQDHIAQPATLATPDLKKAVATLPEGLVINPSSADGLETCSEAQIALATTFSATCPDASKVGTVEVHTPLLEQSLTGGVYLARQVENPFGSLIALYIVVEGSGVVVKIPGEVQVDPLTGRLTAIFDNNPQLPFEDLKLDFNDGSRASLTNPATCGLKHTETLLTPYSAPQSGAPAITTDSFEITTGANGAPCVNNPSEEPNTPSFTAGTTEPKAGAYSPFVLELAREDGSQTFKSLNVVLPPGLVGKLAGVTQCPPAAIATAQARSHLGEGALEKNNPSCPATSEVGTATVGAGSGNPLHVTGRVYLAGPYNGAPFSLVIITPAVAGPFDLGSVVVRSALYINPETAQVTVKSDNIPQSLFGIPLDVRSITVNISRQQFTLNPTSCEPATITATAIAQSSEKGLSTPFKVGDCGALTLHPSFTASTEGSAGPKGNGASLAVKIAQKPGESNIHKVELTLPKALPARLTTLQKACTAAQFAANPAGCPEASVIGTAKAITPLLDQPLTGPAYLVSHGGEAFPDVVFVLQGNGVLINIDGKTDIKGSVTYSKFQTVPDAPITSFETILPEGPHSALASPSGNLCGQTLTMPTTITAQNGLQTTQTTKINVTGCAKPTIKITKSKTKGNTLLLTVTTNQQETLTITSKSLKTLKKTLPTGTHQLKLSLTKNGQTAHKHHHKTKIKIKITAKNSGGTTSKTTTVKL